MPIRSKPRLRIRLNVEVMEVRSLLSSTAVINWSMAPQIALDPSHGNEPDLPNTSAYVNPPNGYEVLLDASKSTGITANSTFTWTITPSSGSPIVVTGEKPDVYLQQGTYTVQLEAQNLSGTTAPVYASAPVTVKDILIVSIGASVASGEGNPVVNGFYNVKAPQWAYSPDASMETENADAHRSTIAGAAQFALMLQEANPQEAVTFVSVANSGATIANGLLGPMQSAGDPNVTLPAELAEVASIVGSHPINVLTMTVGLDDIDIAKLVGELITNTHLGTPSLATIETQVNASLAALPAQYAMLGQALQALHPANVLITEYPNPTRNAQGDFAPLKLDNLDIIGTAQDEFLSNDITLPLNAAIAAAATANDWTYVGGIGEDFETHGEPSIDPWINSLATSLRIEGNADGSLHPNAAGQKDIAERIFGTYEQVIETSSGGVHTERLGHQARSRHQRH